MGTNYSVVSIPERAGHVNQDRYVVRDAGRVFIAVVADGHGETGSEPEEIAAFAQCVADGVADAMEGPADRIAVGFDAVAEAVRQRLFDPRIGAVVGAIAVRDGQITSAHAGDTRLYANVRSRTPLGTRKGGFRVLTRDHAPNVTSEDERLRPFIQSGAFRVRTCGNHHPGWDLTGGTTYLHYVENGEVSTSGIAPSRGFGDVPFQPAYTHVPDVTSVSIAGIEHATFALCSDGARRNVGRAFAKYERVAPETIEGYAEAFREFHLGRVHGVTSGAEDDGTAIFFRADG